MNRRIKYFGKYVVAVYLDEGLWNLKYTILEEINVKNPTDEDIDRLNQIYSEVNQVRNLVDIIKGWVDQHHKGYISAEEFDKKMELYFTD